MRCLCAITVLLCSTLLLVTAQNADCPLPTNDNITRALVTLERAAIADGSASFDPTITGPIHYVCQTQGTRRDTYRSVSIITTYTQNPGEPEETRIFQMACSDSPSGPTWEGDTNIALASPDPSVVNGTTRTDCSTCIVNANDRCQTCPSQCQNRLRRCYILSGGGVCCSVFRATGQCSTDCSSDGVNYVANMSNGYTCTCNLQCPPGHTNNSDCTECVLSNICQTNQTLCQNDGVCTLLSAPDNYTCDCTGTGFEGDNCTVPIPSPSPSPSPSPTSSSASPSPSPCTLPGCDVCDAGSPGCCATCLTGYTIGSGGCGCASSVAVSSSSVVMMPPPCAVDNCRDCMLGAPNCCDTCSSGYVSASCSCQLPTSSPMMSPSETPTDGVTDPAQGIPSGALIGIILGVIFGILLLLTLGAVIAYLIYYFVAGAGSGTNKAKSKSPFANGESHNNPLYLAPDEVEGSNL